MSALFLNFESLVNLSNFAVIVQYVSTCGALLWLRHAKPDAPRPFRSPLGIPVGVIGCLVSLWLIRQVKAQEFILSCIVLVIGFIVMDLFKRRGIKNRSAP